MIRPLAAQPKWSRLGAQRVQGMPHEIRVLFVKAMGKATTIDELPEPYRAYLVEGYFPSK